MSEQFINELIETIISLKKKDLALAFFQNILTPPELEDVARRLQIVKLLKKGVPQREVAEKLGVSIGTVSRGARELKYGAPGFNNVLK